MLPSIHPSKLAPFHPPGPGETVFLSRFPASFLLFREVQPPQGDILATIFLAGDPVLSAALTQLASCVLMGTTWYLALLTQQLPSEHTAISGSNYAARGRGSGQPGALPPRGAHPHPPQLQGWRSRSKAGHTHGIPWSLGRAPPESRWKSLTLNSPHSFSERATRLSLSKLESFQVS